MQIVYTTSNFKGGIYRAVLAILLGLALLIWPADALKYVVMLIGIVFLAIGIIAFIISSRNREEHQRSFAPLSGIGSVILGLLLVCLPSTFAIRFYVSPGIYFSGRCCRTICDPCRSPSVRAYCAG